MRLSNQQRARAAEILRAAVVALGDYADGDETGGNWAMRAAEACQMHAGRLESGSQNRQHEQQAIEQLAYLDGLTAGKTLEKLQPVGDAAAVLLDELDSY